MLPPATLNKPMHARRTETDIIATILSIALYDSQTKTYIMWKAALSYYQVQAYLDYLLRTGLLRKNESSGRTLYKTTERGREFIARYEALKELMKIETV